MRDIVVGGATVAPLTGLIHHGHSQTLLSERRYVKDHVPQIGTNNRARIALSGEHRHHEGAVVGEGDLILPNTLLIHALRLSRGSDNEVTP